MCVYVRDMCVRACVFLVYGEGSRSKCSPRQLISSGQTCKDSYVTLLPTATRIIYGNQDTFYNNDTEGRGICARALYLPPAAIEEIRSALEQNVLIH